MDPFRLMEDPDDRRARNLREVATVLFWGGFALLGVFISTVLAASWPVQLVQPAWQEKIITSLREGAFLPLLGSGAILVAGLFHPDDPNLQKAVRRVRTLAIWAAIGFALMIPLQTYAGVKQILSSAAEANGKLQLVRRATKEIENARTETDLRRAILQIPGISGQQLPESLGQPVPQLRSRLIAALQPRIKASETNLETQLSNLWQNWMLKAFRDALLAGFYAVGFSAIGQSASQRYTLLQRVSFLFNRRGRKIGAL
jgi:hypothetical protein